MVRKIRSSGGEEIEMYTEEAWGRAWTQKWMVLRSHTRIAVA